MDTVEITINDKVYKYQKGTYYYEIVKDLNLKNILGLRINNEVYPLSMKANVNALVDFIDVRDLIGNRMYKSAIKFIFICALKEVFNNLDITFEHSVPKGILAEVHGEKILTQNDILLIKCKMNEIIEKDLKIEKLHVQPKEVIKYYQNTKEIEKAANVQNINDRIVMLYKLKNHMNYFYTEMPYSTGVITEYELIYLGNNRLIFLIPSINGDGKVPEYVHYDNIINSFLSSKDWLEMLKMPYVANLNETISKGKIKEFIESNELMFSLNIARVSNEIKNKRDIKLILISGPSSSGKTTTTKRLASYLAAMGYDPIKISIDDYFIDREKTLLDEFGKRDFESLKAIDVELFNHDLNALMNNEEVKMPFYNFVTGKREESSKVYKLKENSILLVEGLHALNDELTASIDKKYKYKIYLSPFIPLNIDRHNYISTLDLRLLRRIIRDNRTRGYDVVSTIDNWQVVRRGEEKYIFPYIHQADIIINTALVYEIGVIKVFVEPLLYSVGVDSIYYEEARRLLSFLKQFYPIAGEYVNDNSILREFIGGKFND